MPLPSVSGLVRVIRRIDRLFEGIEKTQTGLEKLADRVRVLEDRVTALEAGTREVVTEARAAAAVAASGSVTQHLVDMSRRIGALEAGQSGRKRIE